MPDIDLVDSVHVDDRNGPIAKPRHGTSDRFRAMAEMVRSYHGIL